METTAALPIEQPQEDPADFAALYDRYVERIYRFIYARVHERSLAEDITEEVFFKALKTWHQARSAGRHRHLRWVDGSMRPVCNRLSFDQSSGGAELRHASRANAGSDGVRPTGAPGADVRW